MSNTNGDSVVAEEDRVGANVARLREERGWSQGDVARAMSDRGHSWYQTTVSRVEKGERPLRLVEGVALADAFGIRVDALVGDPEVQDLMKHVTEQMIALRESDVAARSHLRAAARCRVRLQNLIADLRQRQVVSKRIEDAEQLIERTSPEAIWARFEEGQRAKHPEAP